jgi:ABC-type iron transport system FetAB permease component
MYTSVVFVLLGSYETVFNRTKKTIQGMVCTCKHLACEISEKLIIIKNQFLRMFFILLISNLLISFIGTAYVLKEEPFWSPPTFIPVVGMLLGNSMSSVAMATERCLDQFRYLFF